MDGWGEVWLSRGPSRQCRVIQVRRDSEERGKGNRGQIDERAEEDLIDREPVLVALVPAPEAAGRGVQGVAPSFRRRVPAAEPTRSVFPESRTGVRAIPRPHTRPIAWLGDHRKMRWPVAHNATPTSSNSSAISMSDHFPPGRRTLSRHGHGARA
jgi:hypothetical protein